MAEIAHLFSKLSPTFTPDNPKILVMKTFFLSALLLGCLSLAAQPSIPEYGKIDKADLQMTDCAFDPGASAIKLLDYGKVRFAKSKYFDEKDPANSPLLKVLTERRVRIKVLKQEGVELGNVKVPFFAKDEEVRKIAACTYNLDDGGNVSVTEVGKDGVYVQKLSKNQNQLVIVLPNVKKGCVIEYRYILETQDEYFIRDWYFQTIDIPTRLSYYDVNVPLTHGYGEETFINHPSAVKTLGQTKETVSEGNMQIEVPYANRVIYLQNVRSMKHEPYGGCAEDYMQRVYYHSMAGGKDKDPMVQWRKLANLLSEKAGYDDNVLAVVNGSEALVEQARQQADTVQKIKVIYDYLRNHFTCTQQYDIFPDEGGQKVWQKRSGSIADLNLLLVNLLQKAGVNALVFMGSTYNHGEVAVNYPSYRQFNVLMGYVPTLNGFYLLDATEKGGSCKLVPWYMLGTKGLVVNGDESILLQVTDNGQTFKQVVNVDLMIGSDGKARGKASVESRGYAKLPRLQTWLLGKDQFMKTYLAHHRFSMGIDSLTVQGETNDNEPLVQQFKWDMAANSSGGYQYVNTNLFTGLAENPFASDERQTDVEFRYNRAYYLNVNITLPTGMVLDALPQNLVLAMPDKSIECNRTVVASEKGIRLQLVLQFTKPFIPAKQYAFLQDFYKKLFNLLEEPVVLKQR
jgi:hypothetical protein